MKDDGSRKLLSDQTKPKRVRLYDEPLPVEVTRHPQDKYVKGTSGLTKPDERFCQEYTASYDRIAAQLAAGDVPASSAPGKAAKRLADPRIQKRIQEIESARAEKLEIKGELVYARIALRGLSESLPYEVWIPPCRYCYGTNHLYQRTHGEFEEDFEAYNKSRRLNKPPFDQKGGSGYNFFEIPNEKCPNCFGRGDWNHPVIKPISTIFMTPEQRALFAGIKLKDGRLEQVLTHDQKTERAILARQFERLDDDEKQRQAGKLGNLTDMFEKMTPDELESFIAQGQELIASQEAEEESDDE
jgi:phage terminase small subunit